MLPPDIFPILRKTAPGKNGEIQLTDALKELAQRSPMYAHEIQGQRYDAGDKLGFLMNLIAAPARCTAAFLMVRSGF